MSDFYTNVAIHNNKILVNGYLNGKRYKQEIKYRPYLFLPKPKSDSGFKTLDGRPVERLDFLSIRDAKKFIFDYSEVENFEYFGLDKFQYTFINDTYKGEIHYDPDLIVVHNLDIETGKAADGSFAEPTLANGPITLIGVGVGKNRIIFGYKPYTPTNENVVYVQCPDERSMLQAFIKFWSDDDFRPDVVTGWNIERYDLPFIVNRIRLMLGDDAVKKLSPWGILRERNIEIKGEQQVIYVPVGVAVLDYYDLYKKFTYHELESYTLDNVAFVETGKRKLDYSEYSSLGELYEKNYDKFVEYNITDIDRVADIDEKNKFLELAYAIAYDAKVNYIDALTSVLLWDVIIHNYLFKKQIVIPQNRQKDFVNIPGAFVKNPTPGMYEWVMSCDVQSLYPHLIIQHNISPDTFVDIDPWSEQHINDVLDGKFKNNDETMTQCGNGARFSVAKRGFLPELMKMQFKLRADYKQKMLDLKKKNPNDKDIQRYHNFQLAKKIQLNSAYGALANQYFRWYDWRLASAITMSGQLAIRWAERRINGFMNYLLGTNNQDYVIAIDTDSCYINCKEVVARLDTSGDPISFLDNFAVNQVQTTLKQGFADLAKTMNAMENALRMVRENICDKAIWTTKKRYILSIWDSEGVRYKEPTVKFVGVEAVRSVIPQVCREAIKKAVRIIFAGTEQDVRDYINKFRDEYETLPFEDIAFPRGVNGLSKYNDSVTVYKKGSPIHTKASLIYNDMIRRRGLADKYPLIYNGDKIKFSYLKTPNPSQSPVIAAPRHIPEEFNLDKYIDYDLMFQKTFLDPLSIILDAIGWKYSERATLDSFFG